VSGEEPLGPAFRRSLPLVSGTADVQATERIAMEVIRVEAPNAADAQRQVASIDRQVRATLDPDGFMRRASIIGALALGLSLPASAAATPPPDPRRIPAKSR